MKGFVLSAGLGERLRPLTEILPKPLVPVMNIPSIVYSLMLLREAGVEEVIINLHYRSEAIREFFTRNDHFGLKIHFSYEKEVLGTGGGVKRCEPLLDDGDFILINSDIITDMDLRMVVDQHRNSRFPGTVVVCRTGAGGPVSVENGQVRDFKNFLGSGVPGIFEYTGVAVLSPEIFPFLESNPSSVVYTGFTGLVKEQGLGYYEHAGLWRDLGSVGSFWKICMILMDDDCGLGERLLSKMGLEMKGIDKSVMLADGAVIDHSVAGQNCRLGKNALVKDSVLIPDTVIGEGVVLKNAVACGNHVVTVNTRPDDQGAYHGDYRS